MRKELELFVVSERYDDHDYPVDGVLEIFVEIRTSPDLAGKKLEEHVARTLILIDTAGVQMNERLAEIRAMPCPVQCHAVIPADASAANIRRVFDNADNVWASLMLSKLDESTQPWALLQFLTDKSVNVSVASHGDRTVDLVQDVSLTGLVQCALDNLPLPETEAQAEQNARDAAVNEIAASKLSQIAAKFKTETTGLTHE